MLSRYADADEVEWAECHSTLDHGRCLFFLFRELGCSCTIGWAAGGDVLDASGAGDEDAVAERDLAEE